MKLKDVRYKLRILKVYVTHTTSNNLSFTLSTLSSVYCADDNLISFISFLSIIIYPVIPFAPFQNT